MRTTLTFSSSQKQNPLFLKFLLFSTILVSFFYAKLPLQVLVEALFLLGAPGVDLECFISNKNISAWCLLDPFCSPWILYCIYDPLITEINQPSRTPSLLLVIILLVLGSA
jgi:hypothetical protein